MSIKIADDFLAFPYCLSLVKAGKFATNAVPEDVNKLKEKRLDEENETRRELNKIHKKKIAAAEKDRSDRLEEARRAIEKKLKEEEAVRSKEEEKKRLKELEERKARAEETRIVQINEVERSKEIERENLKNIEEKISNNSPEQEKKDNN